MPEPRTDENKEDFIKRCMTQLVGQENYDPKQAYAICNNKWKNKK